jgi:hypothetical protein
LRVVEGGSCRDVVEQDDRSCDLLLADGQFGILD